MGVMPMRHGPGLFVMAAWLAAGSAALADEPSPREIVAALGRREAALKFGKVAWTDRTVHRAGSLAGPEDVVPFPAEATAVEATRSLAWDGGRFAFRYEGRTKAIDGTGFVPLRYANVCGGAGGNRLLRINDSIEYPRATLTAAKALEAAEDIDLIPVLLWARPSAGSCFAIDPAACTVDRERRTVEGRACLVLSRNRGGIVDRWSIDTARDCAIARYEALANDRPVVKVDVTYVERGRFGWVPDGWDVLWSGPDGQVATIITGTVRSIALDERPAADQFELELPRGAWVHDRAREREYVIRADGSERVVTPQDRAQGLTYRDLVRPDPQPGPRPDQ